MSIIRVVNGEFMTLTSFSSFSFTTVNSKRIFPLKILFSVLEKYAKLQAFRHYKWAFTLIPFYLAEPTCSPHPPHTGKMVTFQLFTLFSFGSFYHFFGPHIFDERMARQKGQMETINQSTIQPEHKQSRKNYESYLMRVSALCFYI